jgi:methyl-accepting chemotaxis protein
MDLVAGSLVLLGAGTVLCVLTALLLLATRVDRASEDVSRALDAVADGKLNVRLDAPRGLGREARLAGAASAALARFRTWVDASHRATTTIEQNIAGARGIVPRMRESMLATSTHVQQLTRDSRYLAESAEEQGALTQRACVLASVIGQSNRDTAGFTEKINATVTDAANSLAECAARTAELRALVTTQQEETARCIGRTRSSQRS